MSTTTTFEDEVRAMLARRAADVPEVGADADAPLPTGLRIPVVAERPPARRSRWLVAAAVVVLLAGAVGVVALTRGDGSRERTGPADEPTRPVGPVPPIEGLPQGLTSADLLPVWTDAGTDLTGARHDAALAYVRYLQDRLPAGVSSSNQVKEVEGFPGWVRMAGTLGIVGGDGRSDEVVTYMWWSGTRWAVMAVLSRIQVFSELTVDRRRIEGSIHGDGDRRAAGLGPPSDDLRLDRWRDRLTVVGESPGGDVPIPVSVAAPDGPVALLVAPVALDADRAPSFSEMAFDPSGLPDPGPTIPTPPTIGGGGIPGEGTEVTGLALDVPVVRALGAALPAGEEPVAAELTLFADRPEQGNVRLSTVVDGIGYEASVFRAFDPGEYESMEVPETSVPWGRAWVGVSADRTGVTALSAGGVGVRVSSLDRTGSPAPLAALLAIAEALVADPEVARVAGGGDPTG